MAQSLPLRKQAERCRRLARDTTDTNLRDRLLELADEYAATEDPESPARDASADDEGAA